MDGLQAMFQSIHNFLFFGLDLLPFLGPACVPIFNYLTAPRITFISRSHSAGYNDQQPEGNILISILFLPELAGRQVATKL